MTNLFHKATLVIYSLLMLSACTPPVIGRRWCSWISKVLSLNPGVLSENQTLRGDIEHLLAGLVRVGVPEARRLEESMAKDTASTAKTG